MESITLLKRHQALTRETFDKLLASLDSNRDAAAEKYERIRGRLANFFEYRGCAAPEDYADAVINCAAKKISDGNAIYSEDPLSFFLGIARNILQEYWEQAAKRAASLEDVHVADHPCLDPVESLEREEERNRSEMELKCLEQCLEDLTDQNRELIVSYYVGEKGNKIDNRKKLAAELNLAPGNLRLRAFRLRERLETCVRNCCADIGPKQNPAFAN